MKIKVVENSYENVMALPRPRHRKPRCPSILFRTLLRLVSAPDLRATHFRCEKVGMERLGRGEPCLYLMNHSSFIDLEIAATILYPRPFNIVCTADGFVGKAWLMRHLGCIPTQKFVSDFTLIRDMLCALKERHCSVLMYPEASYSFDGTATPLPSTLGKCLKLLDVPVVMIRTEGAFARDPLYNNLQKRQVDVSARMEYLLSREDIRTLPSARLDEILHEQFSFDYFRWQKEKNVHVREPFRADLLNRVLYRCPACNTEGKMRGEGTKLRCGACGKVWELSETGELEATTGETEFPHIPDWYAWERACVRRELEEGTYAMRREVDIYMMVDTKAIYHVGRGELCHDENGFHLHGCDGKLDYVQKPMASYSLYADYYWYELGDMICIGDAQTSYYCLPVGGGDIVAKTRLATEELYRLCRGRRGDDRN